MDASTKMIVAFVTLILGIALISAIATQSLASTTPTSVSNEQINVSSAIVNASYVNTSVDFDLAHAYVGTNAYKATDFGSACYIIPTVTNSTNASNVYVDPTDILRYTDGTFSLKNTSRVLSGGTILNATYTYCGNDYISQSWGRDVLNLVGGFFAIALMLVGVGLFYSISKDYGLV